VNFVIQVAMRQAKEHQIVQAAQNNNTQPNQIQQNV